MTEDSKAGGPMVPPGAATTTPSPGGPTTTAPDTPTKTPGWYPNPKDTNAEIYWDGKDWRGDRKKDPTSSTSPCERFKRGVARLKWLWIALVAFVPVIAAIAGNYLTQRATAEAAQKAFEQQQERDAYVDFYNAADQFTEDVWAEIRLWKPPDNGDAVNRLTPPMKENLGTGVNNVLTAESRVTFYGSEGTQKAANDIAKQVVDISNRLLGFESRHPQYPDLTEAQATQFRNVVHQIVDLTYHQLQDAEKRFRDAARKDLGLSPLGGEIYNPRYGNPGNPNEAPSLGLSAAPAPPAPPSPPPGTPEPPR